MKKNVTPCIGNDGYYYFTYRQGAKYEIKVGATVAVYEIEDCVYENGRQSYVVGVEFGGEKKHREMTIERLNYLFATATEIKVLNIGEFCELPLTRTEVEYYYSRAVKARNKRRREVNAILKDDKDYRNKEVYT